MKNNNIYVIKNKPEELPSFFHSILGERVIITGEEYLGKVPIKFIDNPEKIKVAQRVKVDLLEKERSN